MSTTPAPMIAHAHRHVTRQVAAAAVLADRHELPRPDRLLDAATEALRAGLATPGVATHARLQMAADALRRWLVATHCQLGHVDSVPQRLVADAAANATRSRAQPVVA